MCLASRKHQWLLLAFDFITHEVPYILVQGLVLGLHAEADLIHCDVVWIHQAVASGCAYLGEQVTQARSDAETGVVRSPCTDVYLRSERLR